MNHKYLAALAFLLILTVSFIAEPSIKLINIDEPSIIDIPSMCTELVGRCTGSAYCTACKNCSRCGYCNSGGSCGVCRKRPQKTYYPKKKKTISNKHTTNNSKISTPSSFYTPSHLTEDVYILLDKTSLRQSANSRSIVLTRLAINDSVQLLDGYSEKYWCKVIFREEIGWVKKHLLQKRKAIIYP